MNTSHPFNWRERLGVYSRLMRVDKPIGTLLLLWPTYWALLIASDGSPSWLMVFVFTLGTFLMRSAGCVINDYADRDIDGAVARTKNRPFALGQVGKKEALLLTASLCLVSLLCLIPLNTLTWWMSLPALFLALTYPLTKRFFPIPQLYLGFAFSFGVPMAFAAETNAVPALAWLIFTANVIWTIAYDTCYAMADKEDDLKLGNIKTSAITFGDKDVAAVMVCHAIFIALMAIVGVKIGAIWPYWLALMVCVGMQYWQYTQIKGRDRQKCFEVFLKNNRIGFVVFVGLVLHYWWS